MEPIQWDRNMGAMSVQMRNIVVLYPSFASKWYHIVGIVGKSKTIASIHCYIFAVRGFSRGCLAVKIRKIALK